jgi:hypothetical protein
MRPGKGSLDYVAVSHAHRKGGVVDRTFMNQWPAGAHRVFCAHHRGQRLVINRHHLRRVTCQSLRRGDHDRDAVADIAHAILSEWRKLSAEARRPADVFCHELGIEGAKSVGCPLVAGQHRVNVGHLLRRSFIDGANARMSMRREYKDRIYLARDFEVGDVSPLPGQELVVFLAGYRLSDAKAHTALSFSRGGSLRQGRGVFEPGG